MFIIIQYPIYDSRKFIHCNSHKLEVPVWPFPKENEFVRYFGRIEKRKLGGTKEWGGENYYSRSHRALRFQPLKNKKLDKKGINFIPKVKFRRFYSDGKVVCRFEVAFIVSKPLSRDYNEEEFKRIINYILSLPVSVAFQRNNKYEMQFIGPHLAKIYLLASTEASALKNADTEDWWVGCGRPMIFIQTNKNERISVYKNAKFINVLSNYGINLWHDWYKRKERNVRLWILSPCNGGNIDTVRRLRLNLVHLHAEQECLREILRLATKEKITIKTKTKPTDDFHDYLNNAIRSISRKKRYGLPQSKIIDYAQDCDEIVNTSERYTLLENTQNMRRRIRIKLEEYTKKPESETINIYNIGGSMTKKTINIKGEIINMGDLVVAEKIENSFNKVQESQINEEAREKLKELSYLIAKLSNQLPSDKAKEVAEDLELFINEAIKEKPRKKRIQISADGLIEAAKVFASLSLPIIKTVKEILSLFGI